MTFPEPVVIMAIEPKTKADKDKLANALTKLADEDPTFIVKFNEETGQTLISGMGELHLEIIVDRLKREFKVGANEGKPQVAYRETIRKAVHEVEMRYVRQTGGRGQYGHVVIDLEPIAGRRVRVREQDRRRRRSRGSTSPRWTTASEEALESGVLAGYPMVDVRATLIDGSYHEVDSSEIAFKLAGQMVLRERPAGPTPCCWSRSWSSR